MTIDWTGVPVLIGILAVLYLIALAAVRLMRRGEIRHGFVDIDLTHADPDALDAVFDTITKEDAT